MTSTPTERRAFLRYLAIGGAALVGAGRLRAQDPQQGALPGDGETGRLYNPDVVQQRAVTSKADNDAFIVAVEKTLHCQCGCNLDVYTCRTTDFTCTTSPELHRDVVALRNKGMNAEQIRQAFVQEYGEEALMAPKPEGFNLAGYFVPGFLMLVGIATLSMWILRRQRQVAEAPSPGTVPSDPLDVAAAAGATPAELERLRRALSEVQD